MFYNSFLEHMHPNSPDPDYCTTHPDHIRSRGYWRCYDPFCECQKVPPEPTQKAIEMLIQDPASGEVRQIHLEHAEFDVTFDILSGTMILKQTVRDPAVSPTVQHVTSVYFNQSNTTFVNLEGLADNSLLFTFELKASTSPTRTPTKKSNHKTERKQKSTPAELKVRVRDHGFLTNQTPFFKAFTNWKGDEKILQLRLPDNRINSWKTVALVLLTYREINIDIWHRMVDDERMGDVAGLNWAHVRDRVGAINPDINTRAINNLSMRDESAKKTKTAIEARLIALQTGMGFKGLSGVGSAFRRPYVLDQALHSGALGFRGRRGSTALVVRSFCEAWGI